MTHIPEPQKVQLRRAADRRSDRALLIGLASTAIAAVPFWFLFRAISSTRELAWIWTFAAAVAVVKIAHGLRTLWVGLRKWRELHNSQS